jgi:hypothetical protein
MNFPAEALVGGEVQVVKRPDGFVDVIFQRFIKRIEFRNIFEDEEGEDEKGIKRKDRDYDDDDDDPAHKEKKLKSEEDPQQSME